MAETANGLTMDRLITGLGDIRASIEGEGQDICQAAVNILFALKEEGAQTTADALECGGFGAVPAGKGGQPSAEAAGGYAATAEQASL